MAKAFISFLGTNEYKHCRYAFKDQPGEVVKYIQEDLIHRQCSQWGEQDEIRIFTTKDAKHKNWQDDGHRNRETKQTIQSDGLETRLNKLALQTTIKRIDIPVGNNEKEIWEIFDTVYNSLREDEEIVFDITHSFRSTPMLFMVLIGYARLLKKINVKGIYYGAFEAKENKNGTPVAPIFDLTSFEQIIQWTGATQSFLDNGLVDEFKDLAMKELAPILKDTRGQDRAASTMRTIVSEMNKISRNLRLNRGAGIINFNYQTLNDALRSLEEDEIFIKPLIPLLESIEKKIKGFAKKDVINGFRAVEWSVSHGLIQQAITMLQENLITFLLYETGRDWGIRSNRQLIPHAFNIVSQNKNIPVSGKDDHEISEFTKKMKDRPLFMALCPEFEKLSKIRNDINHGGYLTEVTAMARSAQSIEDRFEDCYRTIKDILDLHLE